MCILFIAIKQHPHYPLVIAANRDEFFERPTQSAHFWTQHPDVIAGKDLKAGGTWMGASKSGHIAALTNIRDPKRVDLTKQTRGELVINYLIQAPSANEFETSLIEQAGLYNGYNLLFGHWQNLRVYNNHTNNTVHLTQGTYGLSNADLNSPWPKLNLGVQQLQQYCQQESDLKSKHLFDLLLNKHKSEDYLLPHTGISLEWERQLSSIFIQGEEYGTRSSTVVMIDVNNRLHYQEKTFNNQSHCIKDNEITFSLSTV